MSTATGSAALWRLADHFGVVPSPPDEKLTRLLRGWWERPRVFGCNHARHPGAPWFVVAPDASIWCGECAAVLSERQTRCAYCSGRVGPPQGVLIYQEMRGGVTVVGRAHVSCSEDGDHR